MGKGTEVVGTEGISSFVRLREEESFCYLSEEEIDLSIRSRPSRVCHSLSHVYPLEV